MLSKPKLICEQAFINSETPPDSCNEARDSLRFARSTDPWVFKGKSDMQQNAALIFENGASTVKCGIANGPGTGEPRQVILLAFSAKSDRDALTLAE